MLNRFIVVGLAHIFTCLAYISFAAAIPTTTFDVSGFRQLDKGKPKGTLISTEGEVIAGPSAEKVKGLEAAMIWSAFRATDGNTYLGTGDEAKLYVLKRGKPKLLVDLDGVLITCLAEGAKGKLLAGVMPGARVMEIDLRSGKAVELAKLAASHVWDLLYDARGRAIFAASGSPGKIFRIPAKGGEAKVYFDPEERHLLSLAQDKKGNLLAGSATKAILYRISGPKRGIALHDFDANELSDIVTAKDGSIYVAVNKFKRKTSGMPRFDRPTKGAEGTAMAKLKGKKVLAKVRANELRPGAKIGRGALYRIDSKGRVDEIIQLKSGYFTRLAFDNAGTLWAAEGSKGKVYLVRGTDQVHTALDLAERQVLALSLNGREMYLGTGDAGAIYRLRPTAKSPSYQSKIFDAKSPARWGNLMLKATGPIAALTRSGNTAKPDKTWSKWQPAFMLSKERSAIKSPSGRYLQLRFDWRAPHTAALRSFKVYYRPQNRLAKITRVTATTKNSAKSLRSIRPLIKLKWLLSNPDKDPLVHRLYFRSETGGNWRPLFPEDRPLIKNLYTWNTEAVSDDYYRIKVVTSDERANDAQSTLTYALLSEPILVDNRKPELVGVSIRGKWVGGFARDSFSAITNIEYSIDQGPWRLISPRDGIYDSPSENFRIELPENLDKGGHTLGLRARDSAGNLGISLHRFVR
jgi:hypothetical protein